MHRMQETQGQGMHCRLWQTKTSLNNCSQTIRCGLGTRMIIVSSLNPLFPTFSGTLRINTWRWGYCFSIVLPCGILWVLTIPPVVRLTPTGTLDAFRPRPLTAGTHKYMYIHGEKEKMSADCGRLLSISKHAAAQVSVQAWPSHSPHSPHDVCAGFHTTYTG